MTFDRGLHHAEGADKKQQRGIPTRYFKWDADEEKTIRFLTEGGDVIMAPLHEYVLCHDGESHRSFVCRKAMDVQSCELCDRMPPKTAKPKKDDIKLRTVGFAVAVLREAVPNPNGRGQIYQDLIEPITFVDDDEKEVTKDAPWVGILQQSKTFWAYFYAAFLKFGSITDRDWSIVRQGEGKKTEYRSFPNDPAPIENLEERYAKYVPDIEQMLTNMGSEEFYAKWLHGEGLDEEAPKAATNGAAKVTDEEFEQLKKINQEIGSVAIYE